MALVWGTVIVGLLFAVLLGGYLTIQYFFPI
jgi:hypothetical protein